MTLTQIEGEIRTLRAAERIELYKWLDDVVVADWGAALVSVRGQGWAGHWSSAV